MDAVSLFAAVVFTAAWIFYDRADPSEPVVRLFFGTLMGLAAAIAVLGLLLRALS